MTGDRVAEIRGYVANHNALPKYQAEFLLAELDAANRALAAVDAVDQHDRAENAQLRAQLDTVRGALNEQDAKCEELSVDPYCFTADGMNEVIVAVRTALNQGGETNGE